MLQAADAGLHNVHSGRRPQPGLTPAGWDRHRFTSRQTAWTRPAGQRCAATRVSLAAPRIRSHITRLRGAGVGSSSASMGTRQVAEPSSRAEQPATARSCRQDGGAGGKGQFAPTQHRRKCGILTEGWDQGPRAVGSMSCGRRCIAPAGAQLPPASPSTLQDSFLRQAPLPPAPALSAPSAAGSHSGRR